jgi:hypothetical protein
LFIIFVIFLGPSLFADFYNYSHNSFNILFSNPDENREELYIVRPIVTAPKDNLGRNLNMWDYFVFGFEVEVVAVAVGAGGGIIMLPTGLMAVIRLAGRVGVV